MNDTSQTKPDIYRDDLIARLRAMSDEKLIQFGQVAKSHKLAEPLELARQEWRRRHPKNKNS